MSTHARGLSAILGRDDDDDDDEIGEGLVITNQQAIDQLNLVNDRMTKTSDDYFYAANKKKITPDAFTAWTKFYQRWTAYYQSTLEEGVTLLAARHHYDNATNFDIERYGYQKTLEDSGLATGPREEKPDKPPARWSIEDYGKGALILGGAAVGIFLVFQITRK